MDIETLEGTCQECGRKFQLPEEGFYGTEDDSCTPFSVMVELCGECHVKNSSSKKGISKKNE